MVSLSTALKKKIIIAVIAVNWHQQLIMLSSMSTWMHLIMILLTVVSDSMVLNSESLSKAAKDRIIMERIEFSTLSQRLKDDQFHLMFRMDRECFQQLCSIILKKVGEKNFKPESYLHRLDSDSSREGNIYRAHKKTSGGYISGEIKVAITLRILAGASYLDVGCIFGVHHQYVSKIFLEVVTEWFCLDEISPLGLDETLDDENKLLEISSQFVNGKCPSFTGIIGALDGWLVRIRLSALRRMLKVGTGGYWSRKGFYALNVQVIVDKHKRVLWRSINSKGGEHDSKAFKSSRLWDILTSKAMDPNSVLNQNRFQLKFYLIADLAYALRPFLITPYPNADSGTPEDAFNYYHSCN